MSDSRSDATLALDQVGVRFGDVIALDDVSFRIAAGELLCLLGPSGSGKSTLLRVVAGLQRPTTGRVHLAGTEVAGPGVFVEPERRRVGMVFQDYALFPHLTVAANVAFGLARADRRGIGGTVGVLLDRLGLTRHAASYPHVLSGGERQRVALARALAAGPRLLLMDEPFSSLDGRLRDRIRRETVELLRETGTTTLMVTHDPGEAMRIADRIALLAGGRLLQWGSVDEVYARPTTVYAARLFGEVNELAGTCRGGSVHTPLGDFAAPHLPEGGAAVVCIRPHHMRVVNHPTGLRGLVATAEFLGDVEDLAVDVDGVAGRISMRVFGGVRTMPGSVVDLAMDPHAGVVVPVGDQGAQPLLQQRIP